MSYDIQITPIEEAVEELGIRNQYEIRKEQRDYFMAVVESIVKNASDAHSRWQCEFEKGGSEHCCRTNHETGIFWCNHTNECKWYQEHKANNLKNKEG